MYVYPTSTHDPLYHMTVYHALCSGVKNVFYCVPQYYYIHCLQKRYMYY